MKRKIWRIILSVTLVTSLFCGCGLNPQNDRMDVNEILEVGESDENIEDMNYSGPMGRYLEEEEKLPEQINRTGKLLKTKEGLWVFELFSSKNTWFLQNGCDVWEQKTLPEEISNTYTTGYATSDSGAQSFICFEKKEGTSVYEFVIRTLNPDGSMPDPIRYSSALPVRDITYGKEEYLYALVGGTLRRLNPQTGEDENLLNVSTVAERLTILGDKLLVVDEEKVWIYNLTTDSVESDDTVLNDFIKENITGMGGSDSNVYQACTFAGEEENVIYIACKKGLFRHSLYGSVIEQVVDGELSSFGNPSRQIQGAEIEKEEDGSISFLVLFFGNYLQKFTYHEDVPSVPVHQLKVYSLRESVALRQMIALFQQKNPDCYVTYEVGVEGNAGIDTMDLLKKLNTELMAGEGPDVLILDGIDQETYQSKGLLMDLSELISSLPEEEELLPQVVKAASDKNGIYSIPAGFAIPMIVGDKKTIKHLKEVRDFSNVTNELREEYPEGSIWGSSVPECIMAMICEMEGANWLKQGVLQDDSLKKALQSAKEIYETELIGVTQEMTEEEKSAEAEMYLGKDARSIALTKHYSLFSGITSLLLNYQKAAVGYVQNPANLCWVNQLSEDFLLKGLEDEQGVGFKPCLQLAINKGSNEKEKAAELLKLFLSGEGQMCNNSEWMPVNKLAFEKTLETPQGMGVGLYGIDANGQPVELWSEWPNEKILDVYRDAVKKMNHMLTGNQYLLNAVTTEGGRGLKNGKEIEVILDDIKKKTAIYLAE